MNTLANSKIINSLSILGILLALSLYVLLCSPLHPWSHAIPKSDSSVFLYIGQAMQDGQIPYVDIFDHKGPFLYLLNFLGTIIGGLTGVWVLEVLFIFIAVLFCFKTARRTSGLFVSLLSTIVVFVLFSNFYEEGNRVEEYAMPLIFISLYIFTAYFFNGLNLSRVQLLITGICLGLIILLRPDMIGLWFTFSLVILIHSLFLRNISFLLRYMIFLTLGILVAVLPFILYLFINGAFDEFIDQYYVFNFMYSSNGDSVSLSKLYNYSSNLLFGTSVSFFIFVYIKRKDLSFDRLLYDSCAFIFLIVSFLTVLISGREYLHYAMVIIPCYLIPISSVLSFAYDKLLMINKRKMIVVSGIICMVMVLLIDPIYKSASFIKGTFVQDEKFQQAIKVIKDNTKQDDLITVYGNMASFYLLSSRKSVSKYIYQLPPVLLSSEILHSYEKDVKEKLPRIIVGPGTLISQPYTEDDNRALLEKFLIELISQKYNILFENERFSLFILSD